MKRHTSLYFVFIFCLTIMAGEARAQILSRRDVAPLVLTFISGMCDGTAEAIQFHYDKFDKWGLDTSNHFWNPRESWKNKYKDRNPDNSAAYFGSTTFLAFTTDAYHLFRWGRNVTAVSAVVAITIPLSKDGFKAKKWWHYPIQAAIYWLTYSIGFTFTYEWVFG